ncbi:MAG: bifunctional acetaldehyde-CoA/alcohol dehydrogenase [Clostridia bacterium]|nr:bifunctional acetaldehyde-CoA/alcohol dehydrogenase [Clostridia bacterium]
MADQILKTQNTVENVEQLISKMDEIRKAQEIYSTFTQEQVDVIFKAAATAANKQRIPLAKIAKEETGMGIVEDKVIKNHYASENIYNAYKDTKTCGVIEEDKINGIRKIAEPIGLIAAIIPTTNPTSTAIFKALLALKTRNGIIFSPHPRAKKCTIESAKVILEAAVKAGAPEGIIGWIDTPSVELSNEVMKNADFILATGGPGMVKAAYSSGKPALGVGAGNTPAVIHKSADIKMAVSSIIVSKTFDNGMICASEQSVVVDEKIYNEVKKEFIYRGCYFLNKDEIEKVRKTIIIGGALNAKIVGQSAYTIAALAGVKVPEDTKIIIGEVESIELSEEFAHEKLSPVLAMYKYKNFKEAIFKADKLVKDGGYGHTASIFINITKEQEDLDAFEMAMKACRIVVNTPSAHGGIGDLYNFKLSPSLTLGCGSWGGNSVSQNVEALHLVNIKTVAERKENMLWFRAPEKIYFKRGSIDTAIRELKEVYDKKRVFIVTDEFLYLNNYTKPVAKKLDDLVEKMIKTTPYFAKMTIPAGSYKGQEKDVKTFSSPNILAVNEKIGEATAYMMTKTLFQNKKDLVVISARMAAMDAAKIMWTLYEHPDVDFQDLAMRFMDIRKRIYTYPKMGKKANFIAIPTSAGTGSEVTPFAVITDEKTGVKYPLADYELMPDIAIVDVDFMMDMPKGLTAASGVDALTHALEAYVSLLATDYTDGMALKAIKNIFKYLPSAYSNGAMDYEAREKMANASTMAGIAFANAFLGVCHSMAHKLGAFFDLPHGVANALLINEVIKFNATDKPVKMGAFSQYKFPHTIERYAEIASFVGVEGKTDEEKVENLIVKIDELKTAVGIKKSIKDYGVDEKEFLAKLDEMVEHAFDDQCTGANPRYPLMSEIKQMYLNAYYCK